jgi:hypothetical protein
MVTVVPCTPVASVRTSPGSANAAWIENATMASDTENTLDDFVTILFMNGSPLGYTADYHEYSNQLCHYFASNLGDDSRLEFNNYEKMMD